MLAYLQEHGRATNLELAQAIEIREVPPLVNRVANNGPQLLDPVS